MGKITVKRPRANSPSRMSSLPCFRAFRPRDRQLGIRRGSIGSEQPHRSFAAAEDAAEGVAEEHARWPLPLPLASIVEAELSMRPKLPPRSDGGFDVLSTVVRSWSESACARLPAWARIQSSPRTKSHPRLDRG